MAELLLAEHGGISFSQLLEITFITASELAITGAGNYWRVFSQLLELAITGGFFCFAITGDLQASTVADSQQDECDCCSIKQQK